MRPVKELTNDQRSHLRYAILELAKIEIKRKELNDDQLQLIYRILCYGAKDITVYGGQV